MSFPTNDCSTQNKNDQSIPEIYVQKSVVIKLLASHFYEQKFRNE